MSFLINSPNHFLRFRSQPPIGSGPPGHPDRRLLSPDAAAPLKAGGYTCALWNAFPVTGFGEAATSVLFFGDRRTTDTPKGAISSSATNRQTEMPVGFGLTIDEPLLPFGRVGQCWVDRRLACQSGAASVPCEKRTYHR
jgi:hypothetical protein